MYLLLMLIALSGVAFSGTSVVGAGGAVTVARDGLNAIIPPDDKTSAHAAVGCSHGSDLTPSEQGGRLLVEKQHGTRQPHENPLVGRNLQTTDGVALACATQGNAVAACANATLTPQEDLECGACILSARNDTDALAELQAGNYTCNAYTSYTCGALAACPCADPCSQVLADYLGCILVESYSQQGLAFECDISCGASPGGGSSDGGIGPRPSVLVVATASLLAASASFLATV